VAGKDLCEIDRAVVRKRPVNPVFKAARGRGIMSGALS
jgi:hypothetical protein